MNSSNSNGPWKNNAMETSNSSVATSTTSSILNDNNKSEVHHPKAVGPLNATACKNCRKEANFMCSACKSVHYCSLDCQVSFENLIKIISFDVDDVRCILFLSNRNIHKSSCGLCF